MKSVKLKLHGIDKGAKLYMNLDPYLTPVLQQTIDPTVVAEKRLAPPVRYEIEQLPHKIRLGISTSKQS